VQISEDENNGAQIISEDRELNRNTNYSGKKCLLAEEKVYLPWTWIIEPANQPK
jgi:hypothetical protein